MPKLEQLHFDKRNARKHNPRNLGMIEKSLGEVGAARSIVIDEDNTILAGNGTVEVAQRLGMKLQVVESDGETIIAVKRRNLTPEQKQRLALFDNRSAETAEWDTDVLGAILAENHDSLEGMFSKDELADLIDMILTPGDGGDDFDTTPQDGPTRVQRGELWQLGTHRLLCGDSTNADDVARLMNGERADVLLADAPYGMRLDTSYKNSIDNVKRGIKASRGYTSVIGDDQDYDPTPIFSLFDIKEQFWWGADYYRQYLPKGGSWLVWDKRAGLPDFDYSSAEFELCWSRQARHREVLRVRWFGAFGTETQDEKKRSHPTQKPIELYEQILNKTKGDLIVDCYWGTGASLIAAQRTGRRCYGMEIEPKYCDVILKRWEAETGQVAQRVDDGQ